MNWIIFILAILLIIILLIYLRLANSIKNLKRIDKDGVLYYGEYQKNYDCFLCRCFLNFIQGANCSAFVSKNENGEAITGRNYDMPHMDDDKQLTGLNVILKLKPKGKYQSINGVDASWLSILKIPYFKGAFDKKVMKWPLAFLPYLCMDGVNEKGLTVSILALDLKKGESPVLQKEKGKKKVNITYLLRLLLDNCKDLNEAKILINKCNLVHTLNYDYHLFISDSSGKAMVVEWRYNKCKFIDTDLVTNFYLGQDDGQDCYYGKDLKEKFVTTKLDREYHYGYGHGYGRFNTLVDEVCKHRSGNDYSSNLTNDEAFNLLKAVGQDYDGMLTSFTQYSVLYNSTKKSATYCVWQDYENKYTFTI